MKVDHVPLRGCAHQRAAHVTELAAIGAGVHDGGSADGAGNTAGELEARQSSSERSLGNLGIGGAGFNRHAGTFHGDTRKSLGESHDDLGHAGISYKQVAAQAQQTHRLARFMTSG